MRWALAWCLLALAIVLIGRGGRVRPEPNPDRARVPSPRLIRLAGAAGVGVSLIALGGFAVGGTAALVLCPAAAVVLGRLADRPARAGPDPALPLALDLAAASLRSGQTIAASLALAGPVLSAPTAGEWNQVAGLLALGADPVRAWASMADDHALGPVAATARRSADSGARLARAFTDLAVETREERRGAAVARANRAGVFAMAPLGLCFLPAFVCLGIVPTVAGIAGSVLGGLP